jgi:hypothetical protein
MHRANPAFCKGKWLRPAQALGRDVRTFLSLEATRSERTD